jgi:hypothetical protein
MSYAPVIALASLLTMTNTTAEARDASSAQDGVTYQSAVSRIVLLRLVRHCPKVQGCLEDAVVRRMRDEAEQIWSAAGVQLQWDDAADVDPQSRHDLTVVLDEDAGPVLVGHSIDDVVLAQIGSAPSEFESRTAHVWVASAWRQVMTVSFIGRPVISFPTAITNLVLARALGRALAHEIGHYLLGTAHTSEGLMRARFRAVEMLEPMTLKRYGLGPDARDAAQRLSSARADTP